MLADGEPAWLLAWQARDRQPEPAPPPPPPKVVAQPAKPRTPAARKVPLRMRGQAAAIGIIEPEPWSFDGCVRREPVMDVDYPPRVVRKVGWHRCLKCRRPFFSEDVIRQRMCGGTEGCRADDDRFT